MPGSLALTGALDNLLGGGVNPPLPVFTRSGARSLQRRGNGISTLPRKRFNRRFAIIIGPGVLQT